jgi:hypothetical protein
MKTLPREIYSVVNLDLFYTLESVNMNGHCGFDRAAPTGELFSESKQKESGWQISENLEEFSEKTMQTLTVGSFLNLENAETVEALKFTARRLAEMTTAVVAENWQPAALNNLANDLWQKAEYVARETERRRLQEIFNENFCERFRELKPEVSAAAIPSFETQPEVSLAKDIDSVEQSPATMESVSTPDSSAVESATAVEGKKDEFLGFVKTDEPFVETPDTETDAAAITAMRSAPENTEQETVKTAPEEEAVASEKVSTENPSATKPQSTAESVADAKNNPPPATSAVKTGATAPKSADAMKEPFEFGKCTVNLNLTLLPASSDGRRRRAIISAASHGSPPEIEFLEISEAENLTEITALMRGKLERFRQTLPAKYIEQLRQSKTKTEKKPTTVKIQATVAAPAKPETVQTNGTKTNGGQQAQNSSATETEQAKPEITATKENSAAQPAPVAVVPQVVAGANNVQPSLF